MYLSLISQVLCGATLVAGLPGVKRAVENAPTSFWNGINGGLAPLLPIDGMDHTLVPFADAVREFANSPKAKSDPATYNDTATPEELANNKNVPNAESTAAGSCSSSPNIRYEWDDYSTADRQALMSAFKCLMNKPPSGAFSVSTSRWEDFARLHQMYTPNVHQNQKFLPWHRYFVWAFEQVLREECGFTAAFFWFDETKHAGAFSSSDVFSPTYLGTLGSNSHCVTDGVFAGLTANIGPGSGNSPHCLSRQGNAADTAQCSTAYINSCLSNARYQDFERCLEYGPHGYGHNGVGGVMADVYASPSEPFFWFHHTFVDRAWRIWELADPNNRYAAIDGTDINGNPLTLDTVIYMGGIRPDVTIRQIIDTLSGDTLCYRYNY
ncbi:putative tyrosinase [Rosellinia necatrix]|uniref:Putative tyrosinase n=1 Tax=Rosellinia necatrix TaxID=77044 RepID=A0A1W2TXD3_ROSNE|nr:putative tyrosinase [Rosellinia necatrix]